MIEVRLVEPKRGNEYPYENVCGISHIELTKELFL